MSVFCPGVHFVGAAALRAWMIRWIAGVDSPRSVTSHSSRANHSVGRAKASVPIRTRLLVPSLSRRIRCTYQRRISVSRSTGTPRPSTGSRPSSHTGATAWSRCTRSAPRGQRMSTTEPSGAPAEPVYSKLACSPWPASQAAAADRASL